jgi:predicted Zn finger-like uncharacterized protein
MLLTRCPTCHTTFRITADLLVTAGGQARCGRCNNVFDAVAELREESRGAEIEPPVEDEDSLASTDEFLIASIEVEGGDEEAPYGASFADSEGDEQPEAAASGPDTARESPEIADAGDATGTTSDAADTSEVGETADTAGTGEVVEIPATEAPRAPASADDKTISPEEVDAVLAPAPEPTATSEDLESSLELLVLAPTEAPPQQPRRWRTAAAAAAALLMLQIVNHWRAELATSAVVGPPLKAIYAAFGIELNPHWDIAQYQVVDWVAAAEPGARGQSSLRITARIHNRGPRAQPYPKVRLDLTDRWDNAVGSRVFEPREYLVAAPTTSLMLAGSTVEAALDVIDPGPDAYGFELDVCIDANAGSLVCATDQVFR